MDVLAEAGKGDIHGLDVSITLEYETEDMAMGVFESIKVDNYEYVKCSRDGKIIKCHVVGKSIGSILHTIDDFLACVITAENVYLNI